MASTPQNKHDVHGPAWLAAYERTAEREQCSTRHLQALQLVSAWGSMGKLVRAKDVATFLGIDYSYTHHLLSNLIQRNWLERARGARLSTRTSYRPTSAGALVCGRLARELRSQKERITGAELKKYPRAYVKKQASTANAENNTPV